MRKVIVIGAGISGLSAAIYAQRSGFNVIICEQHNMAGGMCTSWKRKGYLFEGAVHWMTGSSPKTVLYQLWKETGALGDDIPVTCHDPFYSVEWEGKTLNIYRDIDKTAEQLLAISLEDKKIIKSLVKDVKTLEKVQMPVTDIKGVKTENPKRMSLNLLFGLLPSLPVIGRLNRISCKDYSSFFKHRGIQKLFQFMPDEYCASSLLFTLASLHSGDGGYPEGGSLGMVSGMEKTFKDLGGSLLFNTKVNKVNINNGKIIGVTMENGFLEADAVIVTQETIAACEKLFDVPLKEKWLCDLKENITSAVCTFIGIGVRAEIKTSPVPVWTLDTPIKCAGETINEIGFYNYSGLKGYAPEGCSALTTALMGDTYDYWKKAKDEGRYNEEKKSLADEIIRVLCVKYPQTEGKIDVIDIATPLTYERYTGAYHGSWMSVMKPGDKMTGGSGFVKNTEGLYFAGHRLMPPGGLPVAIVSGRTAAQLVCRQFGVTFK